MLILCFNSVVKVLGGGSGVISEKYLTVKNRKMKQQKKQATVNLQRNSSSHVQKQLHSYAS